MKKYRELEVKYNVFLEFGYHLVTKEELMDFYTIKFLSFTQNIYEQNLEFIKEAIPIELECYQEIISQKISDVLTGNKPWLQNDIYKFSGAISVSKILKNSKKEFNPLVILNNKKLLSFLLAFDKENGLIEFYQKTFEGKHLHHDFVDGYSYGCEWEDNLSLYTIYLVRYLSDNRNKEIMLKTCDEDPYYNLFKCALINYKIKGNIPDGVVTIKENSKFLRKLKDYIQLLDVYVMPSSLQVYDSEIQNKIFWELILNEGLKAIGKNAFRKCEISNLYIPSTLEHLEKGAFNSTTSTNIYIRNYRNFKNNFLDFDYLIEILFQLKKTGKQKFFSLDANNLEYPYHNYNCATYSCKTGGTICDIYCLVPNFRTLSIVENEEVVLTLHQSDFNFTIEKTSSIFSNSEMRGTTYICSDNKKIKDYFCSLIETYLSQIQPNHQQKIKR